MPLPIIAHVAARLAAVALASVAVAACNDPVSAEEESHADEIFSIHLTVAQGGASRAFTYTQGASTWPTLVLPIGTSTVTATFLDDEGNAVELDPDDDDHELEIDEIRPAGAFTFERTGHFSGTVTARTPGSATVRVCLTHGAHCDLAFPSVPVTIGE